MIEDARCRVCREHNETVERLVTGCTVLSNSEYLARHNRALMILAVTWMKEHKLIGADTVWYKERWEKWFWRTLRQSMSGVSSSTYGKLRQQVDPTLYSKRNTRRRFGFATCKKILIRNGEISLRDIDNLLLR